MLRKITKANKSNRAVGEWFTRRCVASDGQELSSEGRT
jgi:hypothetical protein